METIYDLPAPRQLQIVDYLSLKCVVKLDASERLTPDYVSMDCLPKWLLSPLQLRPQHQNDGFQLELSCNVDLLKKFLMGCEYWPVIRNILRVKANTSCSEYIFYTKEPFIYHTNL